MEDRRKRPLPHFLAEDRRDVGVGVACVNDQRQLEFARKRDLSAKDPLGDVGGRMIVVIVEPGLADADAFGMGGERARRGEIEFWLVGGVMGMGADGEIDRGEALGDRAQPPASATLVEIVTIRSTPASLARATTPSRSSAKSGKSRWQWLSISMMKGARFPSPLAGEGVAP